MTRKKALVQSLLLLAGILMICFGYGAERRKLFCQRRYGCVWSVLELDKKKKTKKICFLARFRWLIQAAAVILTNIHLPNFFKGTLYQGKGKYACVPGT